MAQIGDRTGISCVCGFQLRLVAATAETVAPHRVVCAWILFCECLAKIRVPKYFKRCTSKTKKKTQFVFWPKSFVGEIMARLMLLAWPNNQLVLPRYFVWLSGRLMSLCCAVFSVGFFAQPRLTSLPSGSR